MYTVSVFKTRAGSVYIEIKAPTAPGIRLDPLKPTKRAMIASLRAIGHTVPTARAEIARDFVWVFDRDIRTALIEAKLAH